MDPNRFWYDSDIFIYLCIYLFIYSFITELKMSDFQYFHWFAGHRLSVDIPAVPNMAKESVSNKASWKYFCSSEKKKMADQSRFGPE